MKKIRNLKNLKIKIPEKRFVKYYQQIIADKNRRLTEKEEITSGIFEHIFRRKADWNHLKPIGDGGWI